MTCIDAFKNLSVTTRFNVLEISPCCFSPPEPVDIVDFKNNSYLRQIRNSWENGQYPAECSGCQNAEKLNVTSRRLGSNQWYQDRGLFNTDVELTRIDYWVGDLCNLKCIICGPENSSSWKQELNLPIEIKKSVNNKFWKNVDLTTVKFIHFTGGEPLLSAEHVKLLESLPNPQQVHLNYNTNATVLPTPELLSLWEKFELVQIDFSIDDLEDRFEYQRFPAKWENVVNNLKWFIDNSPTNCMFSVNTTVSILNYNNISNLEQWLSNNFSVNRVNDPIDHRKQMAIGLFAVNTAKKRRLEIIDFLDECDKKRKTNWQQTMPELNKLL